MNKKIRFVFFIIVFLVFITQSNLLQPQPKPSGKSIQFTGMDSIHTILNNIYICKRTTEFDTYFNKLNKHRYFNGNVLIAKEGKIIYKKSIGFSNFKTKEPLNTNTVFQLASLSKQFTAFAIMMLKEKGKLNYDDHVVNYIPDFPYQNITLRMLLSHRSGLPNYIYLCDHWLTNKDTAVTNADIINLFIKHKPDLYFRPNRRFDYSNTGYVILAAIVEKVSGLAFDEFMNNNIFTPLGMNHTFVYNIKKGFPCSNIATGYENRKEIKDRFMDGVVGDKGIYSSIEDIFIWDCSLYSDQLISQETLKEAYKPTNTRWRWDRKDYGFGWRLYKLDKNTNMVYHRGWWHGFQNTYFRKIDDQSFIIILKNQKIKHVISHEELLSILEKED